MRTEQGGSSSALPIALAVGHRCDDLDRSLDHAWHLGQGVMQQALELRQRLGSLHPVLAYPLAPFGQDRLHHTPEKRVDRHRFPRDPLALVRTIMIRDTVTIITVDTAPREGRTHDVCGQRGRQALGAGRDIPFWHVRHQPLALARVTGIPPLLDLLGLEGLSQPRQQGLLPLLA